MPEQLTFDLPTRISRARGDFFVSDANALAVTRLEDPTTWPNRKLVLVGPEGSGKTHLAHVWAEQHDAHHFNLKDRDVTNVASAVAVEVPEHPTADEEETLFHLHNHMQARQLPLLLIARTPPAQWDIALPDLKSRMQATDIVQINTPDDALLAAVMVKQFADRQLEVAPNVIAYLTTHMNRSFAEAERLVDALDKAALAEARAVTRPLAQRVLDKMTSDSP